MAIIAPSSSTMIPHGSQRNVGIESKNAHCTYQVLSACPLAFSAETRGEQPFLVFSQATQQLAPLQREHLPRERHTFCGALSSPGPQAMQGALADLSGSETQRNPGLSDSVLLEREKEEAKPQAGWLCGSRGHHHPTSPRVTWQCPLAMGFSLSPPSCCLFGFLSPSLSSFPGSCTHSGEERTCLGFFHCKEQGG